MGDLQKSDVSITVTGLNPGNYYNVRVIAVGTNNFQSGSSVLRVRTLGRNGRPKVEGCDGSPELSQDEEADECVDTESGRRSTVGIEVVPQPESSPAMVRERSNGNISQRRNTVSRKHSPSTAGTDQPDRDLISSSQPQREEDLKIQLADLHTQIKKIEADLARDSATYESMMAGLVRERDEKRIILQEKEVVSKQLKDEVNKCDNANRVAQDKKTAKEKVLEVKEKDRRTRQENRAKWKVEIEKMRTERVDLQQMAKTIQKEKEIKISGLQKEASEYLQTIKRLEEETHQKGLKIRELEDERKLLPGAQDKDQSRDQDDIDTQEDSEWKKTEDELLKKMQVTNQFLQSVANSVAENQLILDGLQATAMMYQANSSGVDLDPNGISIVRSRRTRTRKSRTNTMSTPDNTYPMDEPVFPSLLPFTNLHNTTSPSFAQGPYIDLSNSVAMVPIHGTGLSDEEFNTFTAGAPLSPTATSLLPSNIFADDDPPSPGGDSNGSYGLAKYGGGMTMDNEPHSPDSSRPASRVSSPQNSSQNLALYGVLPLQEDNDRRSLSSPRTEFGAIGTVPLNDRPTHKIRDLFTISSRARNKGAQDDGLALGTLKHGQSQSFPRSLEEPDTFANRARRMSFSTNWAGFGKKGVTAGESSTQGNAPAPSRHLGAGRLRSIFSNSMGENNMPSERDPSSPRPLSIASSGPGGELPRPSGESTFGWPGAPEATINRNSPLATNWSIHAPPTWSRNPSRRPSLQHGSSSALNVGVASDDDEIIYPSESHIGHASPPPNVGIIGTRPLSSHKPITPRLNPAAPAFRGLNFGSPSPEPRNAESKGKGKAVDSSPTDELSPMPLSSPTASRKSRDTPSIHTQNSIAESYDSLDRASSNALSDAPTPSASGKEKFAARLMRKGSASKFSLSSLSNFRTKKGTSTSDRNASAERVSFDEYSEDVAGRTADSVTSSPMLGSSTSREFKSKDKEGAKEGRMSRNWGMFGMGKGKGKGKESEGVERCESELTTEDEG